MAFARILKNKVGIDKEVDSFLDLVSESGLLFFEGMTDYIRGKPEAFQRHLDQIVETEKKADSLRRSIEDLLYRQTLIPESRGDVLRIIENMDALLGRFKGVLWRLRIEEPRIDTLFHEDFLALADLVVRAVETVTLSIRAYFKDISSVADHMHKVSFWESEADKTATQIHLRVFRHEGYSLCERMQIRDVINHIEDIANQAEDVADSLAIYVIKRSM